MKTHVSEIEMYDGHSVDVIGEKGAGLAELMVAGLPVPPGFVIEAGVCRDYFRNGGSLGMDLMQELMEHIHILESKTGKKFGDPRNPLLLAVRASPSAGLPNPMPVLMNVGLSPNSAQLLSDTSGNPHWAWGCCCRLICEYGVAAAEINRKVFQAEADRLKQQRGIPDGVMWTGEELRALVRRLQAAYQQVTGAPFPENPLEQLAGGISGIYRAWEDPAVQIRRENRGAAKNSGCAVIVQSMVYGNLDSESASGFMITRSPHTGKRELYGRFLPDSQGTELFERPMQTLNAAKLDRISQAAAGKLEACARSLEKAYGDIRMAEVVIEQGKPYLLHTRPVPRSAEAAVQIARDLVAEGVISREEAMNVIDDPSRVGRPHAKFPHKSLFGRRALAVGTPSVGGVASGTVTFSKKKALEMTENGQSAILISSGLKEDRLVISKTAALILPHCEERSMPAIIAKLTDTCCVTGLYDAEIDMKKKELRIGRSCIREGSWISVDGNSGGIYKGILPVIPPISLREADIWPESDMENG